MNFIRKVTNSDILADIMDIPEALKHKKVEILILPIDDNESYVEVQKNNAKVKASLKKYSNTELIAEEDAVWEKVMVDKYAGQPYPSQ